MAEEVFKVRFTQDGAKEIVRSFDDFIRGADTAEEAAARLVKKTNEVRRAADPAQKAYDKLAGAMHTLSRAEQAGIISAGERVRAQERMTITAQANLRPIGSLISKIGEETRAWGMSNTARQATIRTISQVEALMRRGIAVTEQERAAIMSANTAYYAKREGLRAAADAEAKLATEARKAAADQVTAANKVQRENANLLSSYNQIYRNAGTAVQSATAKMEHAHDQLREAQRRGLITSAQFADAERRLSAQYRESVDPLAKTIRLQRERIDYMKGLATGGRQLAQVERELTRLTSQGIVLDARKVASLRKTTAEADRLERAYRTINATQTKFFGLIGGVGIGMGAAFFTRSLDAVTNYGNRLRLVSSDQANANRLFSEVAKIATATRSDLESTVGAYSRIARATKDAGLSQQDALDITKAVTQSFKISGASIQEASASAVQFGQALASNRLGGDELRSILEQAPRLAQAVVDGVNLLSKTDPSVLPKKLRDEIAKTGRLSIGTMREVAKKGLLTTEVVAKAVQSQQKTIDAEFARTVPTIAESMVVLNNKWLEFLNNFNKGTGIGNMIAGSIMFIANNLNTVLPIVLAIGAAMTTAWVANGLMNFINLFRALPLMFASTASAASVNAAAMEANALAAASETLAVDASIVSLNAETGALVANSAAQAANATARGGAAAAGAAAGAGRVVQGGGAAVNAVAAGMAATGIAAGTAAPQVSLLARSMSAVAMAGRVVLGILTALAVGLVTFVAATVAGLGVVIGLWALLRDKTNDATEQMLIYAEGATQKAIVGQIKFTDVALGLWDTLSGKVDEVTLSQQAMTKQASEAAITDAKESTDAQIAAQQELLNEAAVTTVEMGNVFANMNEGIVKDFIDLVGNFYTGLAGINGAFTATAQVIGAVISNMVNGIAKKIADFYNATIVPMLNAAKAVGVGSGGTAIGGNIGGQVDIGSFTSDQFNAVGVNAVAVGNAARERMARGVGARAANRQRGGAGGLNAGGTPTLDGAGGGGGDGKKGKKGEDEAKKLASAYRQLRDELNPLLKITEDYAADQETLTKAQAAGLITGEQHADLLGRLTQRYNDARDPLGKYIRETEAEIGILGLAANQRELATAIMTKEREERERLRRDLTADEVARIREIETRKQGATQITQMTDAIKDAATARAVELGMLGGTPQQIEAETRARATLAEAIKNGTAGVEESLRLETAKELAFIRTRDAGKRVDDMYQELTATTRTFAEDSAALNTLLDQGRIGLERYNRELRNRALAVNANETSQRAGMERSIINLKNKTEDLASATATAFDNAFQSIEDGFAGLFAGQEFNAQQFFANIASDAARILYRQTIDPLVSKLGQALDIPGFASSGADVAKAAAQQSAIEAQKTAIATAGETTRAGLAATTAPIALATAATTQTGIEAAKTTATTVGVAARTGIETGATGIVAGVKATEVATHVGAEGVKTAATVAGTAARTAAEGTAAAATSGFNLLSMVQTVGANAVKAATGAYAAIAGIPVVGPVLAPIAAGAALAGVYALGKSVFSASEGFGSVPYDGAMTELHKEEMVLPAKYANPLRDQLTDGGGGGGAAPEVNVPIKVVNVNDPEAAVAAMDSAAGERVILNTIRNNPSTVAALLKGMD